jgi:hypothetical protein
MLKHFYHQNMTFYSHSMWSWVPKSSILFDTPMYHCVWGASSSHIIKIHYFRNSSNVSDSIIRFQLEKFTVCLSKKIVPHLFTICFIHIFRSEFCDWCRPHKNASNNFRDLCTEDIISIFFSKVTILTIQEPNIFH